MIRYFLLFLFLVPAVSFAAEPSTGLAAIGDTVHSIGQFFSELPDMIGRAMSYLSRQVVLFYFQTKLETLEFCYNMASGIISSFNVTSTIKAMYLACPLRCNIV